MEYTIRKMKQSEYPLLEDFLYEAIFVPEGMKPPARSILKTPELQVYTADFGSQTADQRWRRRRTENLWGPYGCGS